MNYYAESHRPQIHFTPESKWMNDPNGMVYYEGEYHLFYQYYPDSTVWGPMHWGHAVSTDLIHWEHLPIALFPDEYGYIFSGSAVVDWQNTSGLGKDGRPPLIAIFTYHDPIGASEGRDDFQTQGIAYSHDNGRNWTKYEGNPVIPNPGIRDFRDPKVSWHNKTNQWVMIFAAADHVKIFTSPNLKDWTYQSDFGEQLGGHGGVWECPDLFPLTVEGTSETKWVMLVSITPGGPNGGSATQYFVGDFDGKTFTLDHEFATKNLGRVEAEVPDGVIFENFDGIDHSVNRESFSTESVMTAVQEQTRSISARTEHLVNSYVNGCSPTGRIISAPFTIDHDFINFKIGGTNVASETCMNLFIAGKVVRTAAGGNSTSLHWESWEVADFKGQSAQIEIIDDHREIWGHVIVDQIMFSNEAVRPSYDKTLWLDYGKDNYAGVTWADVPEEDGRRIFIGWMSNWQYALTVPTSPWRSAMTIPRTLSLRKSDKVAYQIISQPIEELQELRSNDYCMNETIVSQSLDLSAEMSLTPGPLELELTFEAGKDTLFEIELKNSQGEQITIGYNHQERRYFIDRGRIEDYEFSANFGGRHLAPRIEEGNTIHMHLFIDLASVELFADGGSTVMTEIFFPSVPFDQVDIAVKGGAAKIRSAKAWDLERIW